MRSLCHLFEEARDPDSEIARRWDPASGTSQLFRWRDFRRHVLLLRERIADGPAGPWVLLTEDSYAFAVGLFALWHADRHAISPPNRQPGTLRSLQTRAAGVLSDRDDWIAEGSSLEILIEDAKPAKATPLTPLGADALAVELFTSGTTGAEKPVTKRIRHLDDEVQHLEALWSDLVGAATVFATASHQHLYGLVFGVLWPLCAGRSFQADHLLLPGELVPRIREVGDFALVSVPTHLKRLMRHRGVTLLRDPCRAVFSSGGLLPADTAQGIARVLGRSPVEVLGSTETGAVAWRVGEPDLEDGPWNPFAPVTVTRDLDSGVARVSSPFVSVDESGAGFAMGDRVSPLPDGRFQLQGRADRVVKVGEKRLDLAQMESQLRGHPCVSEVALTLVHRENEPRVAAAVVPTETGWGLLESQGKRAFGRALTASLVEQWDPVVHPRYWRAVRRLPTNPQGKVTAADLRQLFRQVEPEAPLDDRPETLQETRQGDALERTCRVPSDLACLPGHFPDFPVVPGVLQVDWAMGLAADLLGAVPRVEEIESLKFRAPLRPGDEFQIRVRFAAGSHIEFKLWSESTEYSRGRVRVATEGQDR